MHLSFKWCVCHFKQCIWMTQTMCLQLEWHICHSNGVFVISNDTSCHFEQCIWRVWHISNDMNSMFRTWMMCLSFEWCICHFKRCIWWVPNNANGTLRTWMTCLLFEWHVCHLEWHIWHVLDDMNNNGAFDSTFSLYFSICNVADRHTINNIWMHGVTYVEFPHSPIGTCLVSSTCTCAKLSSTGGFGAGQW